jgi:Mlc titration factor MtfA (ptsG expression regulator)
MWKTRRRKFLFTQSLSPDWQRIVETHCPYYRHLPEADRRELHGHIQVFMAEKKFEGCDGLTLTDEIKICIAANACILLLHRQTDYYPDLRSVLVYPTTYYAPVNRYIGHGVMAEGHQARAGESWQHGTVVIAWAEVCKDIANAGQTSVILHEFAHQLDFEDGYADGAPILAPAIVTNGETYLARKELYTTWARVMKSEYERLRARVQTGEPEVLRAYGATNPAEFFAVATESFFGNPRGMLAQHPELYAELKWYFQQDPALWPA